MIDEFWEGWRDDRYPPEPEVVWVEPTPVGELYGPNGETLRTVFEPKAGFGFVREVNR